MYAYDDAWPIYNKTQRVVITNLTPDTTYYYRILLAWEHAIAWNSDQYKWYNILRLDCKWTYHPAQYREHGEC